MRGQLRFSSWLLAGTVVLGCSDDGRGDTSAGATAPTGATAATGVTGVTGVTGETTTAGETTGEATDPTTGVDPSGSPTSTPTTTGGTGCSGDTDCPAGQHCGSWSGECVPEGGCVVSEDCEGGQVCQDGMCVIGGECGAQEFELTKVVPNVMIVLDRSGSMEGDVQDSDKNRWEVAKDAINKLVTTFNEEIRFGLVTYSACVGNGCSAGTIVVPIAEFNGGPIQQFLADKGNGYLCDSGDPETSTGNTLKALVGEPQVQDATRANAVLLITDGNESGECQGNTNGAAAAAELFAQAISVRTYAVGFADGILGSLAEIATNGGTMTPYNANNPASLELALDAIAGAVVSCTFELDFVPEDPNEIYVFFEDMVPGIANDPQNGWTYDPNTNTISFHGTACESLKNGGVVDVDVVFGCDVPIPG
jgi:hypothetical protein